MIINDLSIIKKKIFERFLFAKDFSTYDPYDIWKTMLGIKTKKLFFRNKWLGIIPATILTLFDVYLNNKKRFGYTKQEYPIVRAQAALSLLNLYSSDNNFKYLEVAKKHIDWLISNSSQNYSGYCWGTGFTIVISSDLVYDSSVPFATNTPYVLEAICAYYEKTGEKQYLEVIKGIYQFYEKDLVILEENDEVMAVSYGPFKDRIVTNAVSYTMFAYSLFYKYLGGLRADLLKVKKMYNFLVKTQNSDGSWLYSPYEKKSFIDCFHSAFILKNIIKTSALIPLESTDRVVDMGYCYIVDNFLNTEKKLFKRFSLANKPSLIKFDLYDNAEMLNLAKLLNDKKMVSELTKETIRHFVNEKLDVYSAIDARGFSFNKNLLRWSVMPFIYALSFNHEVN